MLQDCYKIATSLVQAATCEYTSGASGVLSLLGSGQGPGFRSLRAGNARLRSVSEPDQYQEKPESTFTRGQFACFLHCYLSHSAIQILRGDYKNGTCCQSSRKRCVNCYYCCDVGTKRAVLILITPRRIAKLVLAMTPHMQQNTH